MLRRKCLIGIVALGIGATLSAQTVPITKPAFEVASVKKRDLPLRGFPARLIAEHGTFSHAAATVVSLVQFAYDVRPDLVVDGPGWIRTDIFEVNAKAGRDATRDEMRQMMQSLLEERFGLVVRKEQREMRHLLLLPARADRRLGPNIRETDVCSSETTPKQPPLPPGAAMFGGCGTMANIAVGFSRPLRATVIDRTGIPGTFHYYMHTSPEDFFVPLPGVPSPQPSNNSGDSSLPSLRDALRDQLGLKTESVVGPIEVLAIQSVHQPTEN